MAKTLAQMSPAARRKRITQLARDPRTRAAIPTKYLPQKYRSLRTQAQKAKAINLNPLYQPLTPLSGTALKTAAETAAGLEIDPAISALKRERDYSSRLGQARLGQAKQYSDVLAQHLAGAATQARTNQGTNAARLAEIISGQQRSFDQAGDQAQASLAATAQRTGAGELPTEALRLALSEGSRNIGVSQAQQAAGVTEGAGFEGLANLAVQTGALSAAETQRKLSSELAESLRGPNAQITELESKRGPLTTEKLMGLRDKETEKALAVKTLLSKEEQAAMEAAAEGAKAKTEQQRYDEKLNKYGYSNAEWRKMSQAQKAAARKAGGSKKQGPDLGKIHTAGAFAGYTHREVRQMPEAQRRKIVRDFEAGKKKGGKKSEDKFDPRQAANDARSYASRLRGRVGEIKRDNQGRAIRVGGKAVKHTAASVRRDLLAEYGKQPNGVDVVNGIMDVVSGRYKGKLGPVNRRRWKSLGIPIPPGW